jgi:DNA-binding transcriptional LysR family regulator
MPVVYATLAMPLDLAALRTFLAVAETRTFEQAGMLVGRTQPAVSQQMRRLEGQVGVPLFRRHGRSSELTEAGLRLVAHARRLLAVHDEALASLHGTGAPGGLVRIGAPPDLAESLLPGMLRRFAQAIPDLRFEIHLSRSASLMAALHEGALDLAVSTSVEEALPHRVLRRSPLAWIAAHDFRLGREDVVPLLLSAESGLHRRIAVTALERAGRAWMERCTATDLGGLRAAVRAGLGVTPRSVEMLAPDLRVLGDREALPPLGEITFRLHCRKSGAPEAARRLFGIAAEGPA